jgi:hypothetical protein
VTSGVALGHAAREGRGGGATGGGRPPARSFAMRVALLRSMRTRARPTMWAAAAASPPAPTAAYFAAQHVARPLHATRTAPGLASSLRSALDTARGGADEKREKLVFETQMALLSDASRAFDGNRFLDLLSAMKDASGMGGLREHLPWVQNNPALGELKDQQAIIHAMSPDERRRLDEIGIAAKKRVARTTGQSLDSIEAVISQIGTMRSIQRWLVRRQEAGQQPPGTSRELQAMLSAPDSCMSRKPSRAASASRPRPGVNQRRR